MECHDVQQLLAFVNRPSEELDIGERDALRDHLEKCPDCHARLQADRRADEVFAPLMRDVSVPADLKGKILNRLSAERPRPWKTWLAAAAAVLFVVGTLAWIYRPLPEITMEYLDSIRAVDQLDENAIEERLNKQGLSINVPREMEYRFLQSVHVVDSIKGRRVAKLSFARTDNPANAEVFIFSNADFRMKELEENQDFRGTTSIRIWHEKDYPDLVFVAYYRGNIYALMRIAQQ
jgi:hypothetical protein